MKVKPLQRRRNHVFELFKHLLTFLQKTHKRKESDQILLYFCSFTMSRDIFTFILNASTTFAMKFEHVNIPTKLAISISRKLLFRYQLYTFTSGETLAACFQSKQTDNYVQRLLTSTCHILHCKTLDHVKNDQYVLKYPAILWSYEYL